MKLKFTELKREADHSTTIIVILTPLIVIGKTARQYIRKDIADLSLLCIYRTSYSTTAE